MRLPLPALCDNTMYLCDRAMLCSCANVLVLTSEWTLELCMTFLWHETHCFVAVCCA